MPESDGNALPSEQRCFNLDGMERRDPMANQLLDLGLKGLNRTTILPFSMESFMFQVANRNFQQAVECYRYGLYEAAMVMTRAAIDAALYESKYTILDHVTGFDGYGGSAGKHSSALGVRKEGKWKMLSNEAIILGFNKRARKQMEASRDDYGNFAAHSAARHDQEIKIYSMLTEDVRKYRRPPKWAVSEKDAFRILKQTAKFLIKIREISTRRALESVGRKYPSYKSR